MVASSEADALHSDLLARAGFAHAFFTRRGGVSQPPFNSLNFATGNGTGEDVRENFERAARALGVPSSKLYLASQVHGRNVYFLSGVDEREAVARQPADALVTDTPGAACCLRVADCVPILLGDRRSGAIAAVHSGWRGTVANVVASAVAVLRSTMDGKADLVAAIGPHIGPCCFEVGGDVGEKLAGAEAGPKAVIWSAQRARVDLRIIVRAQLECCGVAPANIDDVWGCTSCDADRFFSHRRDREKSGRLLAAIVARTAR